MEEEKLKLQLELTEEESFNLYLTITKSLTTLLLISESLSDANFKGGVESEIELHRKILKEIYYILPEKSKLIINSILEAEYYKTYESIKNQ